jgi:hypothetical protein
MASRQGRFSGVVLVILGLAGLAGHAWADPPKVTQLRVQKVGDTTYFHVRLESGSPDHDFAFLPRLVPQDDRIQAVYAALSPADLAQWVGRFPAGTRTGSLEFTGKTQDNVQGKFLLLYPKKSEKPNVKLTLAERVEKQRMWAEEPLTLDFAAAAKVKLPANKRKLPPAKEENGKAPDVAPVDDNDLEGLWAQAQLAYFTMLETQAPEFGFYSFAREKTSQKYAVTNGPINRPGEIGIGRGEFPESRLYEITTGAAAITETLALNRLRNANFRDKTEQRTIDIAKLPGIDIAEHPWAKMMAGQKPAPEPLAKLVPHDNYYVHFKSIVKFLETGDLMDQWGSSLSRALEVNSRDYQVKERLEQQLCLKSTQLVRVFGPAVVKSLALTGSDPYVREGSDLAIIFHVANKNLFLAAAQQHIAEARTNFGKLLKEDKQQYQGIAIESYVSSLREVSLHRAVFDDYIVYCNSPVGIRRVLDTYKGKTKALADSLDYQYMRTAFRLEDPLEDGFVFLSDAFIRNLVGPATRIKERRRLEALTSLAMVTNGALFTAWETGKLPANHNALLAYTGLKADQIFSPDGDAAIWYGDSKIAFSSFYNTQSFATPLIEIPIDRVTPSEQREYEQFRLQYLGLWRQYFDPIGVRIGLSDKEVRWETYILPLIKSTEYNDLRRLAGDGTVKLDPAMFSDKTIIQFLSHIAPEARKQAGNLMRLLSREVPALGWLGTWFTIRLDDHEAVAKMLEHKVLQEMDPGSRRSTLEQETQLFFQLPLTFGVEIRNPLVFAGVLAAAKQALKDALPGGIEWEPIKEPYKGTTIVQIKATERAGLGRMTGSKEPFTPSLYYALVDGVWYLSLRQDCIHNEIDAAQKRQQEKKDGTIDVNTSLYFSPKAAAKTKEAVLLYLEWETHRRAIANAHLLYPLYRTGVISPADNAATIQSAAMKYLGFVPVSPDYSPYSYERKTDEVVNQRHGSVRRPQMHRTVDAGSPLAKVIEQFPFIRADLRFREDGLNSVVTLRRK